MYQYVIEDSDGNPMDVCVSELELVDFAELFIRYLLKEGHIFLDRKYFVDLPTLSPRIAVIKQVFPEFPRGTEAYYVFNYGEAVPDVPIFIYH